MEQQLENLSGLVLLSFTADWCEPCHELQPHLEAIARAYAGRITFAQVDVTEKSDTIKRLNRRFRSRLVPHLILFADQEEVWRNHGYGEPTVGKIHAALEAALEEGPDA